MIFLQSGPIQVTRVDVSSEDDDRRIWITVVILVHNVLASGKDTLFTHQMIELFPADCGPQATNCGNDAKSSS